MIFQVVSSEEHIFFGRQQVTTNILAPLVSYPIYPQQQVLQGPHAEQYLQQQSPPHQVQIQQQPHQGEDVDSKRQPEIPVTQSGNNQSKIHSYLNCRDLVILYC